MNPKMFVKRMQWYGHISCVDNSSFLSEHKKSYQLNSHWGNQEPLEETNEGKYTKENREEWTGTRDMQMEL